MLEVSCTATKQKQAKPSNAKQSYPAAEVIEGEEAKKSLAADNGDCGGFLRNKVLTCFDGRKASAWHKEARDESSRTRFSTAIQRSSELHFCLMRQHRQVKLSLFGITETFLPFLFSKDDAYNDKAAPFWSIQACSIGTSER